MSTFDNMTKAQLISRLKNREMRVTELFEENVKLKRQLKTTEERWALAEKLEQILGADLDVDEADAIHDAIRLICPEFAEMRDDAEEDVVGWFENTPYEEQQRFVETEKGKLLFGEKKDG